MLGIKILGLTLEINKISSSQSRDYFLQHEAILHKDTLAIISVTSCMDRTTGQFNADRLANITAKDAA